MWLRKRGNDLEQTSDLISVLELILATIYLTTERYKDLFYIYINIFYIYGGGEKKKKTPNSL